MNRMLIQLLAVLAGLWISLPTSANLGGTSGVKLPSGTLAQADYRAGKAGRPAVLILHGFLQTSAFPTVASLTESLASAGYTVLAPTLSLGISMRNKSLACEAIHLHALQDDIEEVAFWVRWLKRKGHSHIILVGHSFGNLQLLSYLKGRPEPAVKQILMISLSDVEVKQNAQQRAKLATGLRARLASGKESLVEAEMGHCKKYVSPPAAMLSYLEISRASIIDALEHSAIPAAAIMGGKDDRMGSDWVEKLQARGIAVQVIPEASHFFDNQFEFDLQDAVLQALRNVSRPH